MLMHYGFRASPEELPSRLHQAILSEHRRKKADGLSKPEIDIVSTWQRVLDCSDADRVRGFALEYEWKALNTERWDSGLYFRYDEVPQGRPWPKRYQVNLLKGMEGDLAGFRDGKNTVPTKAGDWNKFVLTVKGTTASLQVNDKQSWKIDGIENPSGYIGIQAEVPHGGQFLFRNIRITELGG